MLHAIYPFSAVVGQEHVKQALLIAFVNPRVNGLLISGCKGTAKTTLVRASQELLTPKKIINLPLNVTEDMLFGSIDIEYAINKGERHFLPGILKKANGNILYIDEVNLLRQELLTAVLDTNSSGFNHIERDGISFSHEVTSTIIGTMNPLEGFLPSHILDRFGMYVDVTSESKVSDRVEIIKRSLDFAKDMSAFQNKFEKQTSLLKDKLADACNLLPQVVINEAMIQLAAQMCAQAYCVGHRAEIYLLEVARAIAALAKRTYILPQDMQKAALYVLPHRMHKPPETQKIEQEEENSDEQNQDDSPQENQKENSNDFNTSLPPPQNPEPLKDDNNTENDDEKQEFDKNKNQLSPNEKIVDIDQSFKIPKLVFDMGKNTSLRRGSGKRSSTRTNLKQGRYVRAELPKTKVEDLAFDATIRTAAPYQKIRKTNGFALNIQKEDLRQKVREKRIGNTFLFVVDASGSMGARERMGAVKGAIFYMLQDAYQKRDRVGMIAFRRQKAEVLLPITRSVDLAQKCLAEMPTGGKTPLADGLATALLTIARLNKKDSELEPILILVTDGRANAVEENGKDPIEAAIKIAEKFHKEKITSIVIDTENDFIKLGISKKIAQAMGANYYNLHQLSKEKILRIIKNQNNAK